MARNPAPPASEPPQRSNQDAPISRIYSCSRLAGFSWFGWLRGMFALENLHPRFLVNTVQPGLPARRSAGRSHRGCKMAANPGSWLFNRQTHRCGLRSAGGAPAQRVERLMARWAWSRSTAAMWSRAPARHWAVVRSPCTGRAGSATPPSRARLQTGKARALGYRPEADRSQDGPMRPRRRTRKISRHRKAKAWGVE